MADTDKIVVNNSDLGVFFPSFEISALQVDVKPEFMDITKTRKIELPGDTFSAINLSGGFTISALVCTDTLTDNWAYIYAHNFPDFRDGRDWGKEVYLRIRKVDGQYQYQFGTWDGSIQQNNYTFASFSNDADAGKWMQLTGVYTPGASDGKFFRLFKNNTDITGTQEGRDWTPQPFPDGNFWIGAHEASGDKEQERLFQGKIARVNVFSAPIEHWVLLSTDSDNNGYIGSPAKNAPRATAEYAMRQNDAALKRLTYFDPVKCGVTAATLDTVVPPDYRRVPIRVFYFGKTEGISYEFQVPNGLKLLNTDGTNATTSGAIAGLTTSFPAADGNYAISYFVEATASPVSGQETLELKLFIKDSGGTIIEDRVKVRVQEAPTNAAGQYDWIVPSGWIIDKGTGTNWSLTTMVPAEGAIPPKTEGNSYRNPEAKNGYAFSRAQLNTGQKPGFTLTFTCSFLRNTYDPVCNSEDNPVGPKKTGYLQPDRNGDEKIDTSDEDNTTDPRKLSFVGNSGIKIGGLTGVREVAVFDTVAMVDRVVRSTDAGQDVGLAAFAHKPPNELTNYTGVPQGIDGVVQFDNKYITPTNDKNYERLTQLMHGIGYNQKLGGNVVKSLDEDQATGTGAAKMLDMLTRNYQRYKPAGQPEIPNKGMKITWKPATGQTTTGTLTVYLIVQGSEVLYYQENGVSIADGRIYIQSHWGSGVKFDNIQIGAPPAAADTEIAVSESETNTTQRSKNKSLLSCLLVLFAIVTLCAGYLFSQQGSYTIFPDQKLLPGVDKEKFEGVSQQTIQCPDGEERWHIKAMRWGQEIIDVSPGAKVNERFLPIVFIVDTDDGSSHCGDVIKDVNFDGSLLGPFWGIDRIALKSISPPESYHGLQSRNAPLFLNCSFRGTQFVATTICAANCDFQDAFFIQGCQLGIQKKDLMATANYTKHKDFSMCNFHNKDLSKTNFSKFKLLYTFWIGCDLKGCNFSGADLHKSVFKRCNLENADFTDAVITRVQFQSAPNYLKQNCTISFEQIKQTWNYKTRDLNGCVFSGIDFRKADFSRFNLVMVVFQKNTDVTGADFTDAIIASTDFSHVTGLSLKQIESTQSYKDGDRSSYKLPPDIQKALDEEKKAKDAKKEK
ncbi:MAG: pentapeptide repeat-containing protein, partial [Planctomycetaceae bacterium]|nr:pentapeptide repeat-containing protein [Planctomycetaceae bacterium]